MHGKQKGFTLIELIMVIVILGVLSAFALPRFANLGENSRAAVFDGIAAVITSAANMAHLEQKMKSLGPNDSISVDGNTVTMINGYPTNEGIQLLVQVSGFNPDTGGWFVWDNARIYGSGCIVDYDTATSLLNKFGVTTNRTWDC